MKSFFLALAFLAGSAACSLAQTGDEERMKNCIMTADGQKMVGAPRAKFLDECLGSKAAAARVVPQQLRMRSCAMEATDQKLSGKVREDFIISCLK